VGSEVDASARIHSFWKDAAATPLYKDWMGGLAQGLLLEGGLYNSAPLKTFLGKHFDGLSMNRKTNVGIIDMLSGKFVDFDETKFANDDDLTNVMYASLSSVGFYPPVEAFGSSWIDGAAVWDIDIPAAINIC
jgi:predicted acylesterase/phospholipase RssA